MRFQFVVTIIAAYIAAMDAHAVIRNSGNNTVPLIFAIILGLASIVSIINMIVQLNDRE